MTYWLLGLTANEAAQWIYNNKANVDPARVDELYKQNGELKAKVEALEKTGIQPQPETVSIKRDDNTVATTRTLDSGNTITTFDTAPSSGRSIFGYLFDGIMAILEFIGYMVLLMICVIGGLSLISVVLGKSK